MLRLRVGLIQNVMVLELSRAMNCTRELCTTITFHNCHMICHMIHPPAEQGQEQLLDLNPYDVKRLLHLIFSRKEFTVSESKQHNQ